MSQHVPENDGIFLDHVAHWVPDMAAAAGILKRLGFLLTPRTEHTHSTSPGAALEPAGSANQCIMLDQGYLEILTPSADTPIGRELRAGIERYIGVHLAAFCVANAAKERDRLVEAGFPQRPSVALERATQKDDATPATLRFTVTRPQPGTLAEGRVQFLTHHTPELMWTDTLTAQPNGVTALTDLLLFVDDPDEAAKRYQRYLRTPASVVAGGVRFDFARGSLCLLEPAQCTQVLGRPPPTLPWMAAYGLRCSDLKATHRYLAAAGFTLAEGPGGSLLLHLPPALGANIALHDQAAIAWS